MAQAGEIVLNIHCDKLIQLSVVVALEGFMSSLPHGDGSRYSPQTQPGQQFDIHCHGAGPDCLMAGWHVALSGTNRAWTQRWVG